MGSLHLLKRIDTESFDLLELQASQSATVEIMSANGADAAPDQSASAAPLESTRAILDRISDAFSAFDRDWRYTYVNRAGVALLRTLHLIPEELLGRIVWDVFPEAVGTRFEKEMRRSMDQGVPVHFEEFYPPHCRWYDCRCYPSASGMSLFVTDTTERHRIQAELQARTRALETMLHVISHDLCEPLRAIRTFSEIVHDEYAAALDDRGKNYLCRVVRGANRLNDLIVDIVRLTHARQMESTFAEIDAKAIVDDVLGRLEETIHERGAVVRVADAFPPLRVNRTWATEALYNLVANALKFTVAAQKPEIEIFPYRRAEAHNPEFGYVVADRGPGVAPEHRERIFELFQRAVGRDVEGTGAGLAIVREVAERHGGRAWVQSRPGGGSEFVVTFRPSCQQETHVG